MPNYVLIPILFILACLVLYWRSKKQEEKFSLPEIAAIMGVRVALGFLYGYIFARYFNGDDTWYFHNGSIEEKEKLISNPLQFFADFNPYPAFERNEGFAAGWYYYLSDLEFWLITKPLAVFNLVTRGNYYANIVCFNFMVCWGSIWLFRFFRANYNASRKLVFFGVFIMPVPLFWMTGIRAEGWLLLFLAGGLLCFQQLLRSISVKAAIGLLLCLAGILILRSMLLFLLIPVLFTWWLQVKKRWRPAGSIAIVFGIGMLLFFGSLVVDPGKGLPNIIVKRQQAFFALHGQTRIRLDSLSTSPVSFVKLFPQAAGNAFVRPFIWEAKGWLQLIASLSTLIFLLLFVLYFLRPATAFYQLSRNPAVLYPAFFAILLYLFIGYTIPFPGAIIRYKSIGDWFLIIPLILSIRWKKSNV